MIIRDDIEQHSEEWHKVRYGKIGGTLSKGLFVKSDTLLEDVLSELVEEFDLKENYQSYDMIRGSELEPEARKALSAYLGIELLEVGWLQCEENEYLGISPDGISECETISAEIKCPNSKKHLSTVRANEIPNDNINQCLHYFTVNPKLEKHYFCSYRPENIYKPIFVKELTRESIINLGTKARPVLKTVNEWVAIAKIEASELKKQIEIELNKLKF
ncbi:MAG TPA: YqaJ viral recombinase family protein [Flavobacterium sp.]|nr:YqaJ viral recombinase family protein [Flavobacterium sp.]